MSHQRADKWILIGAGGHALVLNALAVAAGMLVIGVCDPRLASEGASHWHGLPVLGGDEAVRQHNAEDVGLINGLGQLVGRDARRNVYIKLREQGCRFPALVHPKAWVAPGVRLADGVQVMAGAIIQPGCSIGENSIVNTRAGVDHDCVIGQHVHVAPGVTLCGGVVVDEGAMIGAGATVLPGLHVGACSVVGAGVTLVHNLGPGSTVLGAPNNLKPSLV